MNKSKLQVNFVKYKYVRVLHERPTNVLNDIDFGNNCQLSGQW